MPLDIGLKLGVTLNIVDEPEAATPPTQTDTAFLIASLASSGSPTDVQELRSSGEARNIYPNEPALITITDAYFNIGGGRMFVSPQVGSVLEAAEQFIPAYGPGQLIAPEVGDEGAQRQLIQWAWENNHIYLASASASGGPGDVLPAGGDAVNRAAGLASSEGRFSALCMGVIEIPGLAPGATRDVDSSVVTAALIARSDILTGNPNLAAAGNHTPGAAGQVDYAVGLKEELSLESLRYLAAGQVNCYRTVNKRVRNYGFWSLADLEYHPQWWDLSGSRTVMAIRAHEEAIAEELLFGQISADGIFIDRYQSGLASVCAAFQRIGAIYGTDKEPGYRIDMSANTTEQLATGLVKATVIVKTSPFAAALEIDLVRRAISQPV